MILKGYCDLLERWGSAKDRVHAAQVFCTHDEVEQAKLEQQDLEEQLASYIEDCVSDLLFMMRQGMRTNRPALKALIFEFLDIEDQSEEISRLLDAVAALEIKYEQLAKHHESTRRSTQAGTTTSRQSAEIPTRTDQHAYRT